MGIFIARAQVASLFLSFSVARKSWLAFSFFSQRTVRVSILVFPPDERTGETNAKAARTKEAGQAQGLCRCLVATTNNNTTTTSCEPTTSYTHLLLLPSLATTTRSPYLLLLCPSFLAAKRLPLVRAFICTQQQAAANKLDQLGWLIIIIYLSLSVVVRAVFLPATAAVHPTLVLVGCKLKKDPLKFLTSCWCALSPPPRFGQSVVVLIADSIRLSDEFGLTTLHSRVELGERSGYGGTSGG